MAGKGKFEEEAAEYLFHNRSQEWHENARKKLVRKMDLHILPIVSLLYLLNFLDRSNLSQARLGTLEQDLGMHGTDFNLLTSILFVGYLLMQLPSNLILTRVRPSWYLCACMILWGVVSTAQAATHNLSGMLACRFFLGFVEAPFFPGVVMLLSSFYVRNELAQRYAIFYGGLSLGQMFGGLIGAGVLGNLDGAQGIAGWRWLFIIEGVLTIGVALFSIFFLPDYPATTRWLTREEKAYAVWRLTDDIGQVDDNSSVSIWEGTKLAFKDYRLYFFALMMHCETITQEFTYFFPTIVKTLGFNSTVTLLLTVPVWAVAFVFSIGIAYHSSIKNERSMHILFCMALSFIGNVVVISATNTGVRFWAMFLMPLGSIPAIQIIIAWLANSIPRPAVKRSAAIAIANVASNSCNIWGAYLYPKSDGPRYVIGGATLAGMAVAVSVLTLALRFCLQRENKKFASMENTQTVPEGGRIGGIELVAQEDVQYAKEGGFRYIL